MFGPPNTRRPTSILAACTAAFLVAAAGAKAQDKPPSPGASAVDQYVEAVPTASDPSVPGITKETRTPLPPVARGALKQATPSTASVLEKVAESSTYGAPTGRPTRGTEVIPGREPDIVPPEASLSATLRSTLGAIGTTSDGRLLGLLIVVFITTLGAVGLAASRART